MLGLPPVPRFTRPGISMACLLHHYNSINTLNDLIQRAKIRKYVQDAFLGKILRMNNSREAKLQNLSASRGSGAWIVGEVAIEEECIAELLHQKADLYIDAYQRQALHIGPDVLKDIAQSQAQLIGTRKGVLISQAQLTATRTNQSPSTMPYGQLGTQASVAMKEVAAKIDLHNLTPARTDPMSINNTTHNLVNSRFVGRDDNSTNIVNEKELFEHLMSAISSSVADETERAAILGKLDELKAQKTKRDYLDMLTKFMAAAQSVSHVVHPYLKELLQKAEALKLLS